MLQLDFDVVMVSRDGRSALRLFNYDQIRKVSDRDAYSAQFDWRTQNGDSGKIRVLFSGTTVALRLDDLGLRSSGGRGERDLAQMALAAIGDFLDDFGTPKASEVTDVQCFSQVIQEWKERKPATDDELEAYIGWRLFWSWKLGIKGGVGFTSHDKIRLRVSLDDFLRIVELGEGRRWSTLSNPPGGGITLVPRQDLLNELKNALAGPQKTAKPKQETDPFVDLTRLDQLRAIKSDQFDLQKLIRLCEEVNDAFTRENYFSTAMLVRAIIDHVPPIFKVRVFPQVANNYPGPKSFRETMKHLDEGARKIGDDKLHVQIRKRETLPTRAQVNFSQAMDVLLAEIVRILG